MTGLVHRVAKSPSASHRIRDKEPDIRICMAVSGTRTNGSGWLHEGKGALRTVRAWRMIGRTGPSRNFRFMQVTMGRQLPTASYIGNSGTIEIMMQIIILGNRASTRCSTSSNFPEQSSLNSNKESSIQPRQGWKGGDSGSVDKNGMIQ